MNAPPSASRRQTQSALSSWTSSAAANSQQAQPTVDSQPQTPTRPGRKGIITPADPSSSLDPNSDVLDQVNVLRKRRIVSKLDADRLLSQEGLIYLKTAGPKLRFHGEGFEQSDLARLMQFYQIWAHQLHPKYTFPEFIKETEKLCGSKRVKAHMSEWKKEAARARNPEVEPEAGTEATAITNPITSNTLGDYSRPKTLRSFLSDDDDDNNEGNMGRGVGSGSDSDDGSEIRRPIRLTQASTTTASLSRPILSDSGSDSDDIPVRFQRALRRPTMAINNSLADPSDEVPAASPIVPAAPRMSEETAHLIALNRQRALQRLAENQRRLESIALEDEGFDVFSDDEANIDHPEDDE
ncbi:chromosome segregation in meiosis- protein [Dimargaris cristalligena]|nr:chromosome segregation in meiosis- protein [Dimargaris cristalligena]